MPPCDPPVGWHWLVDLYWRLKRFLPDIVDPLTPGIVHDYGVDLSWHERELLFALDYEMRSAMLKQRSDNDRRISEKGGGR